MKVSIPNDVLEICRTIEQAGKRAWVVGGSVRDLLLGKDAADWDLATSARPQEIMKAFRRVIPTGIDHGTVTVLWRGTTYEVTTLRTEGDYSDSRHPDQVAFVEDINEDLARRDFTVNAIAYDPLAQTLHDPFGGQDDIRNRALRAVGNPSERFSEDALRIMRAARFLATLEFTVDPDTAAAIEPAADGLASVSTERKRDELRKLLLARAPSPGLALLGSTRTMTHICPDLLATVEDPAAWAHLRKRVDRVTPDLSVRLAALLMGINAPAKWMKAFLWDNRTTQQTSHLLSNMPLAPEHWSDADVRRHAATVGREPLASLVELARADLLASGQSTEQLDLLATRHRELDIAHTPLTVRDLAVDGATLMTVTGKGPGRHVGQWLTQLLDAVLEDPTLNTEEQLLALLDK